MHSETTRRFSVAQSPTSPQVSVVHGLNVKKRRIGVMTSGGDAPGMNGVVRAVVRMAIASDCEAYAVFEGYEGLVEGYIKRMEWDDVRGWLSEGGTNIGTARCASFRERPGRLKAAKNMIVRGIDALIICGGDGSLTGADLLRSEWPGLLDELVKSGELSEEQVEPFRSLNIVGLVGSIDNDMSSTDATIGAYSALTRICEMIDCVTITAASHSRAFVVEVMGRHCGWLALMAGISTGADFVFLPEMPPSENWEQEMCDIVAEHRKLGKRTTIVIVAEGAHDRSLKKIKLDDIHALLSKKLKLDTRITVLGHVQRGGVACAYDRMLATLQGVEAVSAVLEATPETPTPIIAITENKITRKPLVEAVKLTHAVAEAIEAKDFAKATSLRDAEFAEYHRAYTTITSTSSTKYNVPEDKRIRVGIMHIGAPAGGMNPATRAAVAYCLCRGHTPVQIANGIGGLTRHDATAVRELSWSQVERWSNLGGSEIGTNRELPGERGPIELVAKKLAKYRIDSLMVVGGFEAFHAVSELRKAREHYEALRIPMVVLPATVSNNVPGTEFSLGSDTCLNALIGCCDTIRLSASASRRRVFVVETQGGRSGYVATIAGLSTGALAVYTPEEGITLDMLVKDIEFLRDTFALDEGQAQAGKVILRNESADDVYTTKDISDIIRKEAKGRFSSRYLIPGHIQQGSTPSPMDRVRAVRLAVRCIQFLEEESWKGHKPVASEDGVTPPKGCSSAGSACVIGIQGSEVVLTPMETLEKSETDWTNRRPKNEFWLHLRPIVDTLSGRSRPTGYEESQKRRQEVLKKQREEEKAAALAMGEDE